MIGTTFEAQSGNTRYKVLRQSEYQPSRFILEVSIKMGDGSWHVTNDGYPFRRSLIEQQLDSGNWHTIS